MLGQIRKLKSTRLRVATAWRAIATALLGIGAIMFVSCASQKEQVALVNDPDNKPDSQIPWNKQEKWETQAQLGGITDRR